MRTRASKLYLKESRKKALAWLCKLDLMENALAHGALPDAEREVLETRVTWLRQALSCLEDEEKQILQWMADGCTIEEMCEMASRERSSLYSLRSRAITKYTIALFGRPW